MAPLSDSAQNPPPIPLPAYFTSLAQARAADLDRSLLALEARRASLSLQTALLLIAELFESAPELLSLKLSVAYQTGDTVLLRLSHPDPAFDKRRYWFEPGRSELPSQPLGACVPLEIAAADAALIQRALALIVACDLSALLILREIDFTRPASLDHDGSLTVAIFRQGLAESDFALWQSALLADCAEAGSAPPNPRSRGL